MDGSQKLPYFLLVHLLISFILKVPNSPISEEGGSIDLKIIEVVTLTDSVASH